MSTIENDATEATDLIEAPPATNDRRPGAYRSFFLRLHFYAGLFVGPFLLVAAITGGLYALAPSLEEWIYRDYLHSDTRGEFQPVADQIRAAQQVRPDLTVTAVRPAAELGDTTRVMFTDATLSSSSERRGVFVDPVTAEPVGELTVYGSSGALPVRTWLSNLHRSLLIGEPGRVYSELAASWLWLIAVGGAVLWVGRYRQMRGRGSSRARLFGVDRSLLGRARTLNWHGAAGIWIAAGLLFLSATGLTWSKYAGDHVSEIRTALSWTTPAVATDLAAAEPAAEHGDHAGHGHGGAPATTPDAGAAVTATSVGQVDGALAAARAAGVGGKVEVSVPAPADTAFTVAQTRQPWVLSNNSVAVDGATGTITDESWFADWPLAAKLSAWGIQLHMGTLFGLPNQLVLLGLAAVLVTVIVRGYVMWWRRRPVTGARRVGRPPARGVLTGLPPAAAVAVVITAAGVGFFMPLLGLSLLAFLAVDVVVGAVQQRRAEMR
ncbi:PepSY-associated TM helix domain-containing protein [Mycolicibacterium sp. S3B2]|uniref:PepSY-associated TM helix domain-containing protein n=1 Tax=Mycolicibacterium sp. S3B2 TaxID=3415120 RepID=UPI003C79834A